MHILKTMEELDRMIALCNEAEAISDDAMRAVFPTFRMDPPFGLPADPYSDAYRLAQLEFYRGIAGKPYSTANEATNFDVDAAVRRPFPFVTNSSATAGAYFMAIGYLLRCMALPAGSRVLEFGAGWGISSVWLAQLGHHVTTVDIEADFCDLIRRRAAHEGVEIEVVNADFFWIEGQQRQFDAVIFQGCFHHCDDHLRLLQALVPVVAPDGRIFFGAEPVMADFPLPWGVRLDGNSLWAIRKNGWLELGFRADYFRQALARTGWFAIHRAIAGGGDALDVWEARHVAAARWAYSGSDAKLQTSTGARQGETIVFAGAASGTGLYGPYIDLPPGRYRARILFQPGAPRDGRASADVVCGGGGTKLADGALGGGDTIEMNFTAHHDISGVEVRLFTRRGFSATIAGVEIIAIT
jgi:protein-L-isoaspartate O-methyltransferase